MEDFETKLDEATAPNTTEILGAIGFVVGKDGEVLFYRRNLAPSWISLGNVLYQCASGHQTLAPDAPIINYNTTFALASAGKFITHIAALQCVERGLTTLDEPVYSHLPELGNLKVISQNQGPDASARPFLLRFPTKNITLRHLLSHSSGIVQECTPLIQKWRASNSEEPKANYSP